MKEKIFVLFITLLPNILLGQKMERTDTVALRYSQEVNGLILRQHLAVIASDAYEGRETGRKGQKMAADYIKSEFKKLKLKPGNDTSYFQNYPMVVRRPANIDVIADGKKYTYKKDFYSGSQPDFHDQTIDASLVVFCGYGLTDSSTSYTDYGKAGNLKGKVVLVYYGEPKRKDGRYLLTGTTEASSAIPLLGRKISAAKKTGARAMLIVSSEDPATVRPGRGGGAERIRMADATAKEEMPVLYISKEMANQLLGKNLEAVMAQKKKRSFTKKANLKIDIHRDEPGYSGENVIGVLEGTSRKTEYLFVTAHYDHLGIINGEIYNGADDDGSGTVAVLALARAFAKARDEGHGPERSIVFMAVSGEEKGLLGSGWYVDHPTIPLTDIICDLNIDMIGRMDEAHKMDPDYVYVIGSDKLSSELHAINASANANFTHLKLDYTYNDVNDPNRFYYRSDHYNFAKNDIPVVFYFNGVHADYHKETDEIEKIDFKIMEKRARLVFFTAWELSNRSKRIVVDSHKK
jgi:Zn-dependent M28 family amino/carboxypeptidase